MGCLGSTESGFCGGGADALVVLASAFAFVRKLLLPVPAEATMEEHIKFIITKGAAKFNIFFRFPSLQSLLPLAVMIILRLHGALQPG